MNDRRFEHASVEIEPQSGSTGSQLGKKNERRLHDWVRLRMIAPSILVGIALLATLVFEFEYFDTLGFAIASVGFSALAAWMLHVLWFGLIAWGMIALEIRETEVPYEWHLFPPELNLILSGVFLMLGGVLWLWPLAYQVIPLK